MQHISPTAITTSLPARLTYLQSFLSFTPSIDGPLIHACAPILTPLIPTVVDAVYDHLLRYDITAAAFLPAQSQQHTEVASVHALTRDSANITFRKDFLRGYLLRMAANTDWRPESAFWTYLDGVGKAHTGGSGKESGLKHRKNKPPLWVDYREVNLLLGWVEGAVMDVVMGFESEKLDWEMKGKVLQALNKYWWIQNDLFARHYVDEKAGQSEGPAEGGVVREKGEEKVEEKVVEKVEVSNGNGSGGVWGMLGWGK